MLLCWNGKLFLITTKSIGAPVIPTGALFIFNAAKKTFALASGCQLTQFEVMKITDVLRAEHAVFHNLFDHIEAVLPRTRTLAEVKTLAMLADKVMAPHSKTEDDLFIEPLEHCFDQIGQNETFHEEHRQIEEMLADVHQVKTLKKAKQILLAAMTASRKHFKKEERIVFPMAERILKAKTMSELGEQWLRRREMALR